MAFMLSPEETRVLGCLIEKERTTPEQYPLSLNALLNACNQTTNREPITAYDEQAVSLALDVFAFKGKVPQTSTPGTSAILRVGLSYDRLWKPRYQPFF